MNARTKRINSRHQWNWLREAEELGWSIEFTGICGCAYKGTREVLRFDHPSELIESIERERKQASQ